MKAYTHAIDVLLKACTPDGFLASTKNQDNYARVWTRDGVVCGLAALSSGNAELIKGFKNTLETIFAFQHPVGYFPSNVTPHNKQVSYGGAVGRTDNPSWAIIGLCLYLKQNPNEEMKTRLKSQVEKAFWVLDAWEFNGKHLIYVPLSGDWADEYCQHGYILFDQLLRVWALELASEIYKNKFWDLKAQQIRGVLEANYYSDLVQYSMFLPLLNREKSNYPKKYWLMGFNPGQIYPQFDLQANALAVYLKLGSSQTTQKLLDYCYELAAEKQSLLPSFHPSITESDSQMPVLRNNYAYTFRNLPNQFHNGGLWPVWNGFFLAAIKNKHPQLELELKNQLHTLCATGIDSKWEFNECFDGETNEPNGLPFCSWSAAGLILAEKGFYEN
ncbi:MAG: fructofuranosidase/invertase [Bacteroidetes bacterium B1(2017)]|nr:MAG: fructofuranosidase/invertase [Bacteroidetes bacterium B1(2017)]